MMQKTVTKRSWQAPDTAPDALTYWLRQLREERVAAVNDLRNQYDGSAARLQKVARVVQRPPR